MQEIAPDMQMEKVDYRKNPELESRGWDAAGTYTTNEQVGIQWKIRRPKFWRNRDKDFFIEDKDGNRPRGLGWLQLYINQLVAFFIFLWRGDRENEIFMNVYDNRFDRFLNRIIELDNRKHYFRPPPHPERGRDGVMRDVSGFILTLNDVSPFLLYQWRGENTSTATGRGNFGQELF